MTVLSLPRLAENWTSQSCSIVKLGGSILTDALIPHPCCCATSCVGSYAGSYAGSSASNVPPQVQISCRRKNQTSRLKLCEKFRRYFLESCVQLPGGYYFGFPGAMSIVRSASWILRTIDFFGCISIIIQCPLARLFWTWIPTRPWKPVDSSKSLKP